LWFPLVVLTMRLLGAAIRGSTLDGGGPKVSGSHGHCSHHKADYRRR
jgi:hypothetical protein